MINQFIYNILLKHTDKFVEANGKNAFLFSSHLFVVFLSLPVARSSTGSSYTPSTYKSSVCYRNYHCLYFDTFACIVIRVAVVESLITASSTLDECCTCVIRAFVLLPMLVILIGAMPFLNGLSQLHFVFLHCCGGRCRFIYNLTKLIGIFYSVIDSCLYCNSESAFGASCTLARARSNNRANFLLLS